MTTPVAKNKIGKPVVQEQQVSPTAILQGMLKDSQKQLKAVLGDNSSAFMVSLVNLYNTDLAGVDPRSVLNAAFIAAALKLPIEKNLGFAYIYRYGKQAQFICGYRGLIQLALRSGQVKKLNAIPVREGQLKSFNPLYETMEFDMTAQGGDVIGYAAYMELTNGFNKILYMTKVEIEAHADKYSQTYKADKGRDYKTSVWSNNFDEMALKTVIRRILKFSPLSTEMKIVETVDQSSIKKAEIVEKEGVGELNFETLEANFVDNKIEKATKKQVTELLENAIPVGLDMKKVASENGYDLDNLTTIEVEFLQSIIDDKVNDNI